MLENILVFFKALKSLFAGLWRVLDSLRKGLQLLLLFVIAIIFLASIIPYFIFVWIKEGKLENDQIPL